MILAFYFRRDQLIFRMADTGRLIQKNLSRFFPITFIFHFHQSIRHAKDQPNIALVD